MTSTGNRVQTRREELGLSRSALAKRLNTTRLRIYRIENGLTQIPADDLPSFASALETTPAELLA
ncbi:MAG: helix-turn-helix domain-containing protein [Kofleriaceae bacterium]